MKRSLPAGTRIGLVLGAGGSVGCAYHAGVLYSLLHHTGWDARDAESIVGTSAGSLVGALLRSDVDPEELVILLNGGGSIGVAERLHQQRVGAENPGAVGLGLDTSVPLLRRKVYSALALRRSARPCLSMVRTPRFDLHTTGEEELAVSPQAGRSAIFGFARWRWIGPATSTRRAMRAFPWPTAVAASCFPSLDCLPRKGGSSPP